MLREDLEKREWETLSEFATKSDASKGRKAPSTPCKYRTGFQRDRDRILHSKAFRRLMSKTQVFLSPEGDHYTTRLTHSLEVSQIARTIARALLMNEDLTEAIALGHDLGHTPFGHAGEIAINEVASFKFYHSEQSLRVVEKLERDGAGLNLCIETLDGIANHSLSSPLPISPEGQIVRFSDKIAYLNHDADDAIRAGVISPDDLPELIKHRLGRNKSERISSMIDSLVINSKGRTIAFGKDIEEAFLQFREYMFSVIYSNSSVKKEEVKAREMVKTLFEFYMNNKDRLPKEHRLKNEEDNHERQVCDFISGMTDRYAIALYNELFIPKSWRISLD